MFFVDCYKYDESKGITKGGKVDCKKVIKKDIGEPLADVYIVDIVASEAAGVSVRFYEDSDYMPICIRLKGDHLQALEKIETNRRIQYKRNAIYKYIDKKILPICTEFYDIIRSKGMNTKDPSTLLLLAKLASLESGEQIEGVDISI